MEDLVVRRRNRLKHHYTLVSNVIIFGYRQLTDAEKLTYVAIDSFDWPDEKGERKGYAYPSLATLARMRGLDERTIRRHLREWLAGEMLKELKDKHSLGFYRRVAHGMPQHVVFEALSEVRLASREGRVRRSKGALFANLLARYERDRTITLEQSRPAMRSS